MRNAKLLLHKHGKPLANVPVKVSRQTQFRQRSPSYGPSMSFKRGVRWECLKECWTTREPSADKLHVVLVLRSRRGAMPDERH
jgi:hypothetical protein